MPHCRAVFMGSKRLGLSLFRSLQTTTRNVEWRILHPNDLDDPRSVFREWEQTANEFGVDIRMSKSKAETKTVLSEFEPDIALVCGWYQLLDGESIDRIRLGAWGIHNSLLPKYRGGSPLTWSMINGDAIVGSSVFQLSDRMDAGKILLQIRVPNGLEDDISSILEKIEAALLRELPAKWLALIEGTAQLSDQDESQVTVSGQRSENDGLIDWSRDAEYIHNFVRAQTSPYPCAFTFIDNERMHIVRTRIHSGVYFGTPGQVLGRQSQLGGVLVSAGGNSAIELLMVRVGDYAGPPGAVIPSISCRLGYPGNSISGLGH